VAADRLLTRPFVGCFVANLAQGISFNLFLHFPGFLKELGSNEVEIGLVTSSTALAAILVRPWVGRGMDVRGRRPLVLAGGALNILVCALYLTVSSVGVWVLAIRVAHGLAEALMFAALFTYAADHVPASRRTEGLALFGVSGMLPISLGGLLGDALLARSDYAAIFAAALGFAVLAFLLSLPLRDAPRPAAGSGPPRSFGAVAVQRDLLALWWIGTAFSLALAAVFVFIKPFVLETGLGSVGLFFTTYTGVALVLRLFFAWLPDRVGPKRLLFPALGMLWLGFVLLAGAETERDVLLAGACCGAGHGYTFPILFGMVVTRARESERGAVLSIFTALFDGGVLVGGPLFGWVHGRRLTLAAPALGLDAVLQGYVLVYAAAAAILAAGAVAYALLDRGRGSG
jgi:MFS family permease